LSWANIVEVQVDLGGRIHPKTAPHADAWPSPLSCVLVTSLQYVRGCLAPAATPVEVPK
jgi:hypothetical protein